MTKEQKLLKRYCALCEAYNKKPTRLKLDAISRIERDYKILTGNEINSIN